MRTTQTIELNKQEKATIENFLKLIDEISDIARCSMSDVFIYFADKADIVEDGYCIETLHQISDITG